MNHWGVDRQAPHVGHHVRLCRALCSYDVGNVQVYFSQDHASVRLPAYGAGPTHYTLNGLYPQTAYGISVTECVSGGRSVDPTDVVETDGAGTLDFYATARVGSQACVVEVQVMSLVNGVAVADSRQR